MDASTLSALIDTSSKELEELHRQLGCPNDEMDKAMSALKACIYDAIHAQVRQVETRVAEVKVSCEAHERRIKQLCSATGAQPPTIMQSQPLLAQRDALQAEEARLESVYAAQCDQCDLVLNQIHTLNTCMSEAGGAPSLPTRTDALRDVTPNTLCHLESHLLHVQQVYKDRKLQMESDLSEILQLWSELHVLPDVAINAGHVSVHDERPEESQFHMSILQYTQQMPSLELDGEFRGQFEPMRTAEESTMDATPTRIQGTPTLVADTSAVPELLQPTDAVMAKSIKLRESLEREKAERESSIQSYYDELCELWMRFDVPETEMDAFVLDHRGSTLQVVEAYRTELDKMRALKSQHMALFISKTREQIWEQWDALYMSEAERRNTFPAYFLALPGEDETISATFDWDELLAEHESMYAKLAEMLEQRAPILSLIGRYHAICHEARALEESAQDGSRLLGRGNRGDPGRLLREEKMRKRVKVQKPKLEQELLKVLPAWEAEHQMPFMMDGTRFVDYLRDQLGGAKENPRTQRRALPQKTGAELSSSRAANGVLETPRQGPLKRPGTTSTSRAPTSQARRGGVHGTSRPRIASQSRMTPYGAVAASKSGAKRLDSTSSTDTVVHHAAMLSSSITSPAPDDDDVFSAGQRTPSSYLASSFARSQTPAMSRF